MNDGLSPTQVAFLAGQQHHEAFEDLSAADINRMDMTTYARLTGRQTMGQFAAQTIYAEPPGTPRPEPEAAPERPAESGPGIDLAAMDMDAYIALRGQLGIGQSRSEGVGIMNQPGSQTWAEAARRQPGRSGWQTNNVVESPRMHRVFSDPDEHLDTRTVAQRLSNQANMWQG